MRLFSSINKPYFYQYTFIFILTFCFSLWIFEVAGVLNVNLITQLLAKSTFIIHALTVLLSFKLYKIYKNEDKIVARTLLIANIGLFLNDIAFYYIVYNPKNYTMAFSTNNLIYDILPYALWILCFYLFLAKIITRDIYNSNRFTKFVTILAIINIVIIIIYLSSIHYALGVFSWQSILQIFCTIMELIIFDLAILCLIYSGRIGFPLVLISIIILIASDFIINYKYLSQTTLINTYGELGTILWVIGLLFMLYGVFILTQQNQNNINGWMIKINSLKSKMATWAFFVSLISILPFFILSYLFFPANKRAFVILPPFIMLITVIVVSLSNIISKNFEKKLKEISSSIKDLMLYGKSPIFDEDIFVEEINFLHKFIYEAYTLKEDRDRSKTRLGTIATQVAHDIRSPVAAILMMSKDSIELPEEPRIILRDAAHRIQDIANNLLEQAREKNVHQSIEKNNLFLASAAILSVISEKKLEYKNTQITIVHEFKSDAVFNFIQANLTEFKRVISNLINNAVEAMNTSGQIIVRLSHKDDSIDIDIIDAGNGMPQSTIDAVMKGESISSKSAGLGLGLSHAKTFLQSCGAQLNILSTINGTTVSLIFKKRSDTHCWIANEIKLNSHATIVILDDDISIHGAWDRLLTSFSKAEGVVLKIMHFTQVLECLAYLRQLQAKERDDLIMLTDYKLIKQDLNGLDVIEQSKLQRAILVTSYYDNEDVIKRAMLLNTKILPKMLVSDVKLTLTPENIQVEKKSVDPYLGA